MTVECTSKNLLPLHCCFSNCGQSKPHAALHMQPIRPNSAQAPGASVRRSTCGAAGLAGTSAAGAVVAGADGAGVTGAVGAVVAATVGAAVALAGCPCTGAAAASAWRTAGVSTARAAERSIASGRGAVGTKLAFLAAATGAVLACGTAGRLDEDTDAARAGALAAAWGLSAGFGAALRAGMGAAQSGMRGAGPGVAAARIWLAASASSAAARAKSARAASSALACGPPTAFAAGPSAPGVTLRSALRARPNAASTSDADATNAAARGDMAATAPPGSAVGFVPGFVIGSSPRRPRRPYTPGRGSGAPASIRTSAAASSSAAAARKRSTAAPRSAWCAAEGAGARAADVK